jgi:hypothetical protein
MICALYAKGRAHDLKAVRTDLQAAQGLRRKEWARVKQALAEAAKAKKEGGFWKKLANVATKVAKVAAVVGSIALAISTAGAATPIAALAIAGAVMSTGAFVQGETQFLQKLGMDSQTADWIGVGLSLGGVLASGGASVANGVAGGAEAASAVEIGGRLATGASGVAHAACGIGRWQGARHDAEADRKLADAAAARLQGQRVQRAIQRILASFEEAQARDERVIEHLAGAMEGKNRALFESSLRV